MAKKNAKAILYNSGINQDENPDSKAILVAKNGRIVIPVDFREKLGLKEGSPATITLMHGELRIIPGAQALRSLQSMIAARISPGRSLANELLEERKRDTQDE